MKHIESEWETPDHIKLFTHHWEPEIITRAVIVLVNGLGEHGGRYKHVAKFFTDSGVAVIGFDHRGHGKSGGSRGHIASYDRACDDVQHFIDEAHAIYPGRPCFLYGHSLGGAMVLYHGFNRKSNLNGIICTAPVLEPAEPVGTVKLILAKTLSRIAPSFTMDNGLDRTGLSRDPTIETAYSSDPLVHGRISASLGMDLIRHGKWMKSLKTVYPYPLLVMQGDADRIVSPDATREMAGNLLGDVTYKEWPDFYHELHNEPEKEQVLKTILDWVNSHLK
jgi:acylglycerol lipase